jgi:uncharacterized protein YodC (DUF2158 family)
MAEEKIVVGDTVMIKSGGPIMTVNTVDRGIAYCQWFEKNDLKNGRFSIEAVKKVNPNDYT